MYDQFYGFSARPFQLAPDPAFYFESLTHRKALSYLGYGLAQGEGFIVITGEVGAGKSTLAAHLVASVDRQRLTVGQIVTSSLDGAELVRLAAQAFGVVAPTSPAPIAAHGLSKATVLGAIEAFFHDEARAGRRCLLIVDEAQNLTIGALEELRMLSNYQLGAHPLVQILLLGQPEFRALLQTESRLVQLRQRVIATHHLDAMEPGEVGAYIEHRLVHVGWQGRPVFADGVYARLAQASGCVPRRVNQLANRLLLLGGVEHAETIDCDMLEDVIADLAGDEGLRHGSVTPAASAVADGPGGQHNGRNDADAAEPAAPATAAPVTERDHAALLAELSHALGSRDEQIAELQQAVMELAEMRAPAAVAHAPEPDLEPLLAAIVDLTRRIDLLEGRTADQNEAIRHILTMLIEWLENENATARAA